MSVEISTLTTPLKLGEGPHWDDVTQALYFVDIYGSTIYKYVPASDQYTYTKVHIPDQSEKPVSLIIPVKGEKNKFVITYGLDVASITWDGENSVSNYQVLASASEETHDTRINDGKVSPSGILFAGTMARACEQWYDRLGNFYSFKNFQPKRLLTGIGISNGLAWSDDEKIVYYIDSLNQAVEAFDYDAETAEISNRRQIFHLTDNGIDGVPDGMTIDTDGNLWVACYGGSRVVKVNPKTGSLLLSISLPAEYITSVAFGGKNLDELYVTSALPEKPTPDKNNPKDGCTFRIRGIGSTGLPGVPIDLKNLSK